MAHAKLYMILKPATLWNKAKDWPLKPGELHAFQEEDAKEYVDAGQAREATLQEAAASTLDPFSLEAMGYPRKDLSQARADLQAAADKKASSTT